MGLQRVLRLIHFLHADLSHTSAVTGKIFNPSVANALLLYPLKTSENRKVF